MRFSPAAACSEARFNRCATKTGVLLRYVVEADRVVHTLTGSWNEHWTGTQQTRFLSFEGDRLVYTTPETVDPIDGKLCTYKVTFERA